MNKLYDTRAKKLAKDCLKQRKKASKAELKAMNIAEKAAIADWRERLAELDADERAAQEHAFRTYLRRRYRLRRLILLSVALCAVVALVLALTLL